MTRRMAGPTTARMDVDWAALMGDNGWVEGRPEGCDEGIAEGWPEGTMVGCEEGYIEGIELGCPEGRLLG